MILRPIEGIIAHQRIGEGEAYIQREEYLLETTNESYSALRRPRCTFDSD